MQALKKKTKKQTKEVPLSRGEKIKLLRKELENVIKSDMQMNPALFHGSILSAPSKYAKEFSQHMIDKLREGRVLVLNETVVRAAAKVGIGYGIDELYRYLDFDPPMVRKDEPEPVVPLESRFRGC